MTAEVDLLRRAEKMLREQAKAATPGPWMRSTDYVESNDDCPIVGADDKYLCVSPDDGVRGGHSAGDADYIVTMHPGVGLALADWLGLTARDIERAYGLAAFTTSSRRSLPALVLARLIVGEGS